MNNNDKTYNFKTRQCKVKLFETLTWIIFPFSLAMRSQIEHWTHFIQAFCRRNHSYMKHLKKKRKGNGLVSVFMDKIFPEFFFFSYKHTRYACREIMKMTNCMWKMKNVNNDGSARTLCVCVSSKRKWHKTIQKYQKTIKKTFVFTCLRSTDTFHFISFQKNIIIWQNLAFLCLSYYSVILCI